MSEIDDLIQEARAAVTKKVLAGYLVPETDEERQDDRIVMWMDPSEFRLFTGQGDEVFL